MVQRDGSAFHTIETLLSQLANLGKFFRSRLKRRHKTLKADWEITLHLNSVISKTIDC